MGSKLRVIWRIKIGKCFHKEIFIYFGMVQKGKLIIFVGRKDYVKIHIFLNYFPQILNKSCIFGLFNAYIKLIGINCIILLSL
jgi:hypothetical protein